MALTTTIDHILNARLLTIGRTVVTPVALASAAIIVALSFFASGLLGRLLTRARERAKNGRTVLYVVQKLVTYGLVVFGLFIGASTLGINLSSLAVFAGAIGVGVGLGLQGVVREFVSGLVLIFDNELHVGDFIELESGGTRGVVVEIGARATHVRTNDNVDVLVPNSKLIDGVIINWTQRGNTRRIHVPFSVAYGVDKEKVRDAVLRAARALPFTLPDDELRKTQVWMVGFGDSALNFELVVWPKLEAVKRPASMQAAYTWAIEDALRVENIEIPYPQVDLRVRSLFGHEDDAAVRTLGLQKDDVGRAASRSSSPSRNDAAEDTIADEPDPPPPTQT